MTDTDEPASPRNGRGTRKKAAKPADPTPGAAEAAPAGDAPALHFNPRDLLNHYLAGEHEQAADKFIEILQHFRNVTYYRLDEKAQYFVNAFVKNFLYIFSQEDFVPDTGKLLKFLEFNVVIANVVAMSDFKTTDAYIKILLPQKKNFVKLLALYSPRNKIRINRDVLFATEANFASIWYHAFLENYKTCCVAKDSLDHQRFHLSDQNRRMTGVNAFIHHAYFGCTYIDHENDYKLKQRINALVRAWPPAQKPVERRPRKSGKPKIGVFTSMWFPRQSVYRTQQPFLAALRDDYEMHLIHLGPERANLDTSLFASVAHFRIQNAEDFAAFSPNSFDIAYFPDIGMNIESIFLSNLRIAEIQIAQYGHPVSTFGAQVDYWIGGRDTELLERSAELYSERLVLIPGSGVVPVYPDYELRYPAAPPEPVLVNCAWTGQKINHEHLLRLKRVIAQTKTPIVFRFFPGGSALSNGYLPLKNDLEEVLGADHVVVFRDLDYQTYMHAMESAHFAVDSFPFGGYNTAIDQFFLRKPMVCLRGDRFYNRGASYLLKRVGLEACVCDDEDAFIAMILRLAEDAPYRDRLVKRLGVADLRQSALSVEAARHFRAAIDHLHANHAALKKEGSRAPILIED